MRNSGKEVKLFTSTLKAFQCNTRIVMAQRKHLDDCLRGRIIGRQECGRTQMEVSKKLGIAPGFNNDPKMMIPQQWSCVMFSDESRFSVQSGSRRTLIWRAPGTRYHQENTIGQHRYGGTGWLVWEGIILGSKTDLHV
ncbi:transposable element Tcb1 transposase [Trichonephila clavipes]|nr:transposable element Tcb1 transposase [Trichonephila clavipes]